MPRTPQWVRHPLLLVALAFLLVTLVGYLLDRLLLDVGESKWHLLVLSNTLDGVLAAGVFYLWQMNHRRQMEMMQQRMEIVSEMNHHIRNALQVIVYFAQNAKDVESAERLRDSIDRIQWALREVLPRYTPVENDPVPHIN